MSADEYRDRFGIRRSTPLTSPATRERMSEGLKATIAEGKLDAHFAGNADRAGIAAAASKAAKRDLRRKGIDLPHGTPPTPREVIEAVVVAIEAGAKVGTAVKRSPIAYTTFHAGLGRHPDLKARAMRVSRGYYGKGIRSGAAVIRQS